VRRPAGWAFKLPSFYCTCGAGHWRVCSGLPERGSCSPFASGRSRARRLGPAPAGRATAAARPVRARASMAEGPWAGCPGGEVRCGASTAGSGSGSGSGPLAPPGGVRQDRPGPLSAAAVGRAPRVSLVRWAASSSALRPGSYQCPPGPCHGHIRPGPLLSLGPCPLSDDSDAIECEAVTVTVPRSCTRSTGPTTNSYLTHQILRANRPSRDIATSF
jgi:hypothetical protein